MKRRAIDLVINFTYTLASNLVSMVVSVLVVMLVPKLIGVEAYGYWQLYLFYTSYVGFLHFGWNDGIYLRYGGKEYKELDKGLFFSQFCMLVVSQLLIAGVLSLCSTLWVADANKNFIFHMTALCLLIVNVRYMLLYVLQGTNRIKEYAQITIMDRALYCCLIVTFLAVGIRAYKLLIAADLIGKAISLLYAAYCCRDIVFRKISTFYFSFRETAENINAGIKLMFANIASTLIIGVVRLGIDRSWSVATFGKVSLTLSVSNFMMLFINAVGLIMFPMLRRTDEKKLPGIYETLRTFLMVTLLGLLLVYYPLKAVLTAWLPKYADSLMYMALVFPMCIFEGKMALLINTYLKTLRKEKLMLQINLISLALSVVITSATALLLKNLNLTIAAIVFLLAFRCVLAELFLAKILDISVYKDISLELIMTLIFILTGWFINSWLGVGIYAAAYMLYLFIKHNDIACTINNLKMLFSA